MTALLLGVPLFHISCKEILLLHQQDGLNYTSVNNEVTKAKLFVQNISEGILPLLEVHAKYDKVHTKFVSLLTPRHEDLLEAFGGGHFVKLYSNTLKVGFRIVEYCLKEYTGYIPILSITCDGSVY